MLFIFFFQAEDGIRDIGVTGVQTCALPISSCGMWDAASAWFDEQCHVCAQDSNQRNTGAPAVERANLTTQPRGQPQTSVFKADQKGTDGELLIEEVKPERSEERRVGKECRS